ncbi:50S ribosomal protein L3 N(5)-glutamine methyltransferase [Enterobacteriaceae endosymbiont of Macroplea mutica]|uniref:50S ribosomal protein L3 N(5)-glutamine methyltransferase n=1 Tax=Enterobacteriaceae endosymbiont of Macroplea mutica TaxID=2675791 RepID=UPI0014490C9E|nr:50S ribosomal protein L3 N(5)-glutamine methyltransferase [Enterobacteriaceae endosymbiont of Macroplea mutica]QJC31193.1 50S ribosomal protein L3 N(5)-glutamine methyltransferase [Enterobacteriaceae endosymbiont of Macroplea mutica]
MIIKLQDILNKDILLELFTIQDFVRWATSCFSISEIWYGHGNNNPWDEAIQLILPTLGLPPYMWHNVFQTRLVTYEKKNIYYKVHMRITQRIPVAYLTNKVWFCGHELYVDKRTLIPRSPIQELINNKFEKIIFHTPKNILDLGTGNGCIAIACSYLYPKANIDAVDISQNAINVTEQNIFLHGLEKKITPICSNLFDNLHQSHYDLIISNPPYINRQEMEYLPKEYLYEPIIGLVSTKKGLDMIYKIIKQSRKFLKKTGIVICEVGNQKKKIQHKYPNIHFEWLKLNNDDVDIFKIHYEQLK